MTTEEPLSETVARWLTDLATTVRAGDIAAEDIVHVLLGEGGYPISLPLAEADKEGSGRASNLLKRLQRMRSRMGP